MKERVQRYFPLDTIQMRENPELIHPKRDAIHIGLIGSLSVAKGSQVIKTVSRTSQKIIFLSGSLCLAR